MPLLERPTFESEDSKEIYQYVERRGTASIDEVQEALDISEETFESEVERLTGEGYLSEEDGQLGLELDIGTEATVETRDFTYSIRPALDEDYEPLVDLIREVTSKRTYVVGENLAEELFYDDTVTRHNSVWSRVFFVATVDDRLVGWTHLDLPQMEKLQHTAQVTVGVRADYRGYNVGANLLDRALEWAESNDYRKVYNSVAATNVNAISFLEDQGWGREGVREDHYTIDGKPIDEVMMAYTFE
jgi:ribosomal protein S18 acetylase RimI-like enzyme